MFRKGLFWLLLLLPSMGAGVLLALFATALVVVHITYEEEAFKGAPTMFQELARDVYERQRSIWQAQKECIVFDEVLFYKPKAGRCAFNNVEFSSLLSFDEHGFRQTISPSRDKTIRGRIVVLGDSQAMGWGVQDEETFASVLASDFNFEVFNLGVPSYGTARELLRMRREFDIRSGDTVVIQYHPNDLPENLAFLKSGGLPPRSPADLARLAHTAQPYGVLQVSASVGFILKGKLVKKFFGNSDDFPAGPEAHADAFLATTEHFPELANVRLIVCEVDSFGRTTAFPDILKRLAITRMTVLQPTWELSDFYQIDGHLNAKGHHKLAQLIADTIFSGGGA